MTHIYVSKFHGNKSLSEAMMICRHLNKLEKNESQRKYAV